ncbi:MAG: hypothetical protein E7640_00820 [Ruminococcaceae bacterium]|nr:hypothetical protein [Oscillospiraceae bacterium]
MKKARKFIIIFLVALLIPSAAFGASAESFSPSLDHLPEDSDGTVSLYSKLGELQTQYFAYPSGGGASLAISPYRDALDLSLPIEQAKLLYYRGVVAAYLAFLYNGNEAVSELYSSIKEELDSGTYGDWQELYAAATAKKTGGGIIARLLAAIYEGKLCELADGEASDAVCAIVEEAKTRVNNVPADKRPYEITEYELILNGARSAVKIRKMQDVAKRELRAAFDLIYPNGDIAEHECIANALAVIDLGTGESDSEEKINAHMKEALTVLVGDLGNGKKYNSSYVAKKLAELDALTASEGIAEVSGLFLTHGTDLERAETKDRIADEISRRGFKNDEKMAELEAEYNGDGGTLDGCDTREELSGERKKASLRIELYEDLLSAKRKISEYLTVTPLLSEADAVFSAADIAIRAASTAAAEEKYEKAREELLRTVDLAEAKRFRLDHKEILEKGGISSADRPLILAAMADAVGLSGNARDALEGKFDGLAKKYRTAILERLGQTLGSRTDMRAGQKGLLAARLEELSVSDDPDNFAEFIALADGLVAIAEASDKLFCRYEAIVAASFYPSFLNGDKNSLKAITEASAEHISADASKLDEALTALDRGEASARINAARHRREDIDETAKGEIEETVKAAKGKIEASRDPSAIKAIADAAVLDIEASFSASDTRKEEKDAKTVAELTPIIIVLSATLFAELCAIAVLVFLLKRKKKLAVFSFFTPVSAGLTVGALTLMNAAAIACIIYLALKFVRKTDAPDEPLTEIEEEAEETEQTEEIEEIEEVTEEEPPDEEIFCAERTCGKRKAEINLDVIEKNFDWGETVTLEGLREKGLIPRRADAVKVLGRGELEKPLTVMAQDFSETAERSIISAGGEAIHI